MAEEELKVYDPIDAVPEDEQPVRTRASKWDSVIESAMQVADSERPWLPVARPKGFSGAQAKWLRKRSPHILVVLGPERVFIKWDPAQAAAERDKEAKVAAAKEAAEQA